MPASPSHRLTPVPSPLRLAFALLASGAAMAACEADPVPAASCLAGTEGCPCDEAQPCTDPLVCAASGRCEQPGADVSGASGDVVGEDAAAAPDDTSGAVDAGAGGDSGTGPADVVPPDSAVVDAAVQDGSEAPVDASEPDGSVTSGDATTDGDAPTGDDATTADVAEPGPDAVEPCSGDLLEDLCACADHSACASGWCQPGRDGEARCAPSCDAGCPEGWRCLGVTDAAGEVADRCLPADLNLVRPCLGDHECGEGLADDADARCVLGPVELGSFCGVGCSEDGGCPPGYACLDAVALEDGAAVSQCAPETSELSGPWTEETVDRLACTSRAKLEGATTSCAVRRCAGTRTCSDDGLGPCTDDTGVPCPVPVRVAVTLDPQGGEVSPLLLDLFLNEPYGPLPQPTRVGYIFEGWLSAPDSTAGPVTESTVVTQGEAHSLYAAWRGRTYAVTYDSAGGSTCAALTVIFGDAYGDLCQPTRPGYAFAGWVLTPADVEVDAETAVGVPADHTLRARWTPNTYLLGFDSRGGSPCETISVTFGAAYGPLCASSREGWLLEGWFTAEGASGLPVTATSTVTTAGNHTLIARWKRPPEECAGGVDEDFDGLFDCFDPDCVNRNGCPATLPGDTCATAAVVNSSAWANQLDTCRYANNFGTSGIGGCKTHGSGGDAVLKFVPTVSGTYRVNLDTGPPGTVSGFDSTLNVVRGASCPTVFNSCLASADGGDPEQLDFAAVAGETYWILADGYGSRCGMARLTVSRLEAERCGDGVDNDGDGLTDCNDITDCNGAVRPPPLANCPSVNFRCQSDVTVTALPYSNPGRDLCNHSSVEEFDRSTATRCKPDVDSELGGIVYAYTAPAPQRVRVTVTPIGTWFEPEGGEWLPIDVVLNLTRICSNTADPTPCLASSDVSESVFETAEVALAAGETLYAHVNLWASPFGNDCGVVDVKIEAL
jgi:uncharacterized repeat protein (TIGR02543 family)